MIVPPMNHSSFMAATEVDEQKIRFVIEIEGTKGLLTIGVSKSSNGWMKTFPIEELSLYDSGTQDEIVDELIEWLDDGGWDALQVWSAYARAREWLDAYAVMMDQIAEGKTGSTGSFPFLPDNFDPERNKEHKELIEPTADRMRAVIWAFELDDDIKREMAIRFVTADESFGSIEQLEATIKAALL